MTLLASANGADVHCCDWRALVEVVRARGGCDAVITDTPYSARTHRGHDFGNTRTADESDRRDLDYPPWTPDDVRTFVEAWHPLCSGWFVTMTDHVLARAWEDELIRSGRYVFPWIPLVAPGSRVRRAGDGPSCWTIQIVVARPRRAAFMEWGTLDGAYILPTGEGGKLPVVGGKWRWAMERLVEDYSRPGDLVVDPCCGAGTTAAAAIRTGRRAIVGDAMQAHAEMAARWITDPQPKCPTAIEARQGVLFGGG